ncbi:Fe2+-enterobactin ABC transporter substrate-binding protein [Isoptericola aurantiacus]|uniref:Fe2+-enterobactin ABC transporter substrate-binding protein n=1 Tax=Isoptericola aurantiacus TaxID=3377839 RepID=UPI003839F544
MHRTLTRAAALVGAAALTLGLAACGADEPAADPAGSADSTADAGEWPRTVEHEAGSTELEAAPERIVSTSITLTGTLLAIDAPVVASAATTASDDGLTDANGFFTQWADVAAERGVEVAYPDLELDLEAVIAADPDLIVASSTGADATIEAYDQLSEIAPTIVVDYSDKSWQEVATYLGDATGLADQAEATIAEYDSYVADAAASITVPEGETNLVVYNGSTEDAAIGKPGGPHAEILTALGFDVVGVPDDVDTAEGAREDWAFVSIENTVEHLTAPTVLVVFGDEDTAEDLRTEPLFASAPAVTDGVIEPLGVTSFRIDYYSALGVVDAVTEAFGA